MKLIFILAFSFTIVQCQALRREVITYPEGNRILYSEFTGIESQRLIIYSFEEQKEYEVPLPSFSKFPSAIKFSPDGKKILIKDPDSIDGLYIFNLLTNEWEVKVIRELNQPKGGGYLFADYLNDSTAIFKGTYLLSIVSLNTTRQLDKLIFNDTLYCFAIDINSKENLITLNYGTRDAMFNSEPMKVILYNYNEKKYVNYFDDTGFLYQWIPGTNKLFMRDSIGISYNLETREKVSLQLESIQQGKVIYPGSKFIDNDRIVLQLRQSKFSNDFYLYNILDTSLTRITYTETEKNFKDLFFIK